VENIVENSNLLGHAFFLHVGKFGVFSTKPQIHTKQLLLFCFIAMQKNWKKFVFFTQIFSHDINRGKFSPKKSPNFSFPHAKFSSVSPSVDKQKCFTQTAKLFPVLINEVPHTPKNLKSETTSRFSGLSNFSTVSKTSTAKIFLILFFL
jgi:hypothetical protein